MMEQRKFRKVDHVQQLRAYNKRNTSKYVETASSKEEEEAAVAVDDRPNVPGHKNFDKGSRQYDMCWNRRQPKSRTKVIQILVRIPLIASTQDHAL
ncbi:hypothetical protein AVEN_5057-1 [Araneus ventricosus]|uniref:Uncharacterized protein n=1 Tax=Araneus ventricosus TaxID=182803 RepID=A0A4Y2TYR5_ARAVE|nr:hypothetical protein AVEN_5057-1 [Araneus ventricosus]